LGLSYHLVVECLVDLFRVLIAVLLPAVGIEPTSRYQRTFLRRKPYTTRLPKYLSNSISTSVAEWYKASVVGRFFGTATWVEFDKYFGSRVV